MSSSLTKSAKKKVPSNSNLQEEERELIVPKPKPEKKKRRADENFRGDASVIRELKSLYKDKLLPIERNYVFHKFNHPEILDAELGAKPTVLLVGQYSTGKTSFIKYLIGMDYPEIHIGPEPTTDRFIAVVHGDESKTIKGNALTGINELPFSGLSTFGSSFLNKFSAAVVPAPLLKDLNIIDTPGVLSGEKQRTSRGYDFAKVCRWFAERSDLILLLFDCSKLDISDEFKSVIEELQPHEDKVHCVLNKADQLDQESLMRVYGALLWSMGRIFKGAEVTRIYVGSYRDEPIAREEHTALFEKDKKVLLAHLKQLPKACSMRKVNEMVKRIRLAVVHVCVLGTLRSKMPYLWGKESAQAKLIENLQQIFDEVRKTFQLAEGDFPRLDEYKAALQLSDIAAFPRIDRKTLNSLQEMLLQDIPRIISIVAGVVNNGPGGASAEEDSNNADSDEDDDSLTALQTSLRNSSRQPAMFKFSDSEAKEGDRTFLAIAFVWTGFIVVIAGITIMLILDETRFVDKTLEHWKKMIGL